MDEQDSRVVRNVEPDNTCRYRFAHVAKFETVVHLAIEVLESVAGTVSE